MTRANLLLSSVLVATAFAVGCEWTSSDGIAWDESYNNVNFSGTYPVGDILVAGDDSGETGGSGTATAKETIKGGSGQLKGRGIQSATVVVHPKNSAASVTGTASAPGALTFSNPNYSGSVTEDGLVTVDGGKFITIGSMDVSYSYTYALPTTSGSVTSITVHQTGQNVTMTLNDGSTFSGKISGYDASSDALESAAQVIAKYNVSGSKGKISGTLTSTTSSRIIDGVMTIGGSSTSFSGSISGAGRSVSTSVSDAE